jgi:hypothetical protein
VSTPASLAAGYLDQGAFPPRSAVPLPGNQGGTLGWETGFPGKRRAVEAKREDLVLTGRRHDHGEHELAGRGKANCRRGNRDVHRHRRIRIAGAREGQHRHNTQSVAAAATSFLPANPHPA